MKFTGLEISTQSQKEKYVFSDGLNIIIPDSSTREEVVECGLKVLFGMPAVATIREVSNYTVSTNEGDSINIEADCPGMFRYFYSPNLDRYHLYLMSRLPGTITVAKPILQSESEIDAFRIFRYVRSDNLVLTSREDELVVRLTDREDTPDFKLTAIESEIWCWLCGLCRALPENCCVFIDHTLADLFNVVECKKEFFTALGDLCKERSVQMILVSSTLQNTKELKEFITELEE